MENLRRQTIAQDDYHPLSLSLSYFFLSLFLFSLIRFFLLPHLLFLTK